MQAEPLQLDLNELMKAEPLHPTGSLTRLMWLAVLIGTVTFLAGLIWYPIDHLWGAYYVNVLFFMGLAAGSIIVVALTQICHATWVVPVRRLAEANAAFLPWIYLLLLCTYFGRTSLFPWARAPMPGREWWMQPEFVYVRFAVLIGVLFFMMWRFVRISLRSDIGLLREQSTTKWWRAGMYDGLVAKWKGSAIEPMALQRKLAYAAPILVILYIIIYSLFAFEMIMGMDTVWYSNMFGGFIFIGNVYVAFAVLAISTVFHVSRYQEYGRNVTTQQLWDTGKLTFAFCILWGYLFFSQFLPQWYGNLPEETQWLIVRTREFPWKGFSWVVFPLCFIFPFVLNLSEDLKKNPLTITLTSLTVVAGIWGERYLIVMPQISPHAVPFGLLDIGLFIGFLGAYVLSIESFLARYPYIPVSHPQARGITEW